MENVFLSIETAMGDLFSDVMLFLPQAIVAILVLVVGWILGSVLGKAVMNLFKKLQLDDALDKAGIDELSRRAGYAFHPAKFVGKLVQWFIILAFLVVAFDILGLEEVTTFMREVVLDYLPQVFAAVLILFASVVVSRIAWGSRRGCLACE